MARTMKLDLRGGNNYLDLTQKVFGRLTTQWIAGRRGRGPSKKTIWLCSCSCGRLRLVNTGNLRSGQVQSCGCIRYETMRITGQSNRRHGLTGTPQFKMWRQAKRRAAAFGLEFSISVSDIVIPSVCPLLHIPMFPRKNGLGPNSPSLDRIVPSLGYIVGNIQVISMKANLMKGNATLEEMQLLVRNWEKQKR
jgi:hypothetical protein